jgi:hypothetical protein
MRTFASVSLFFAVVGFSNSQTIIPSSVPLSLRGTPSWEEIVQIAVQV